MHYSKESFLFWKVIIDRKVIFEFSVKYLYSAIYQIKNVLESVHRIKFYSKIFESLHHCLI